MTAPLSYYEKRVRVLTRLLTRGDLSAVQQRSVEWELRNARAKALPKQKLPYAGQVQWSRE